MNTIFYFASTYLIPLMILISFCNKEIFFPLSLVVFLIGTYCTIILYKKNEFPMSTNNKNLSQAQIKFIFIFILIAHILPVFLTYTEFKTPELNILFSLVILLIILYIYVYNNLWPYPISIENCIISGLLILIISYIIM